MTRTVTKKRQEQNPMEFYQTPAGVTRGLLASKHVHLPTDGMWIEPCAGKGAIVSAVTAHLGATAPQWDVVDVDARHESDLRKIPRVQDVRIQDARTLTLGKKRYRVAITNPPFSLAGTIYAAMRPVADYLVMLLRVGWVESKERAEWLATDLPDQGALVPRPSFTKGRHDSAVYAWMIWGPERREVGRFFLIRWRHGVAQRALQQIRFNLVEEKT